MQFIDYRWISSTRFYHAIITADRVTRLAGRVLPPMAILGALSSGLWLITFDDPRALLSHSTLRGLHLIFGLVILGDVVYRIVKLSRDVVYKGVGRESWRDIQGAVTQPGYWLEWTYWGLLGLMTITGLARVAMERYGFDVPLLTPVFGWGVSHVLVSKFFISILILRFFLLGTARGRRMLDYLRQP